MKIRTIEKLEEKISSDFSWRQKELIDIKTLVADEANNISKDLLIRAGIALLCAHWEGFIRYAANMYVVYVGCKKIKNKDLNENFMALKLRKAILNSGKTEKNSVHTDLVKRFFKTKEENFHISYTDDKRIIETHSNLSYDLFEEILKNINIENIYKLKKNYIDYNLLKHRHEVVHGEKTFLSKEDFFVTFEKVIEIMEQFKAQIISAAENELYLKRII